MEGTNINNRGFKEKNAKVKAGKCMFPFKYKRKTHTKCFPTERGDICATSLSKYGTLKTYAYCRGKKGTAKKTLKKKLKLNKLNSCPVLIENSLQWHPKKKWKHVAMKNS